MKTVFHFDRVRARERTTQLLPETTVLGARSFFHTIPLLLTVCLSVCAEFLGVQQSAIERDWIGGKSSIELINQSA